MIPLLLLHCGLVWAGVVVPLGVLHGSADGGVTASGLGLVTLAGVAVFLGFGWVWVALAGVVLEGDGVC